MKILVAYDGSEWADEALNDLQRAGLPPDSEILVMSVANVFIPPPLKPEDAFPKIIPESVKRAHKHAQEKLEEAKQLAERGCEIVRSLGHTWTVHGEAKADSPAWAIIKMAENWEPDLIVMGARGLSAFGGRLILGSISQRVLYEAPSSVRIARYQAAKTEKPVRILIGVDNSLDSKAAVNAVCARNWPADSEVGLLVVVDTVMAIPIDPETCSDVKWIDVSHEENWLMVRELIEPAAQQLRQSGLHAEVLIRRGHPADEIIDEAHGWDADCIFVGAKGTRGLERLLLGSVSSAVSARAHCSVEVVRIKK